MRHGILVLATLSAAACRKGGDGGAPSAGASASGAASTSAEVAPVAPPAVVSARCRAAGAAVAVPGAEDLELGDALAFGDGYAVALAHRTAAGRVGGVALVARDAAAARVIDLGPTLGDAPPPRLALRGKDLLAAVYGLPKRADARELRLLVVTATGEVKPLAVLPQQRDDSLASDLVPGLVAWDEVTVGASPRGVVRVAELSGDHAGAPRDVSPPDSDAEMPRIVHAGSGHVVLWLSRHPEPRHDLDAATPPEAIGDARAYSWVEAITLDASGAPVGTVRRLTPATGHVTSYDAALLPGDRQPDVLVVARDDGESVDGSGGTLFRVRLRDDGAEPPLGLPGDGLGRGAPGFVATAGEAEAERRRVAADAEPRPSWLAWVGPHEELRLLALDAMGAPLGPPSAESAMSEARPLLATTQAGEARMLVAFPGEASAQLKTFTCVGR
jgi:hypothetical protein